MHYLKLQIYQFQILNFVFVLKFVKTFYQCHSCLKSCDTTIDDRLNLENCDCEANLTISSKAETCASENCFVKVEFFPNENVALIQKGCIDGLPSGINGCHYAGQHESVHCYCQGNLCNNKKKLNSYIAQPLPTLECCECSQSDDENCLNNNCSNTCRGNYCLVDFDGIEQGCGLGLPRLQSFLRIPNYFENFQGSTTCARYQATLSTSVHGCICTKPTGTCNELEKMRSFQTENVIKRRVNDQNYCYSLHQRSFNSKFYQSVYNQSDTCEGHYCFFVLTTSELVVEVRNIHKIKSDDLTIKQKNYIGKSTPRFEILTGCLKVDDDKKVNVGCTVEYSADNYIISKHCICDSHLCNFFDVDTIYKNENNTIKIIHNKAKYSKKLLKNLKIFYILLSFVFLTAIF